MSNLSTSIIVEAPAEAVWDVVGRRFDRIGEWATAIAASTALATGSDRKTGSGRTCTTGIRLVPHVTETIVDYDEARRTLTYEATGLPRFVAVARNTWTVVPLGGRRSRVEIEARFTTRGLVGRLFGWAILIQARRAGRQLAGDLRHFVEDGAPSARKRRQLRRARRAPSRCTPGSGR